MITNTTELPVNLAGEILRNIFLTNSEEYVSTTHPLTAMPQWAANRCRKLIDDSVSYYGILGRNLLVIQQNNGDSLLIIWDIKDGVLYWNDDAKKDHGWQREN